MKYLLPECQDDLERFSNTHQVILWVPGNSGVRCNNEADELARKRTVLDFVKPETSGASAPVCQEEGKH